MIGYTWGKVKESLSGWEKSHFGGFYRMIQDYPYIKIDFDVKIELSKKLSKELGWYVGEKLIKLYLLKASQTHCLDLFSSKIEEIPNPFTGKKEKYVIMSLDNSSVFKKIIDSNEELAPLFDHYREDIFASLVTRKVPEDNEQNGENESDDDNNDKQEQKAKEELKKALSEIKEFKPRDPGNRLSGFEGKPEFRKANCFDLSGEHVFTSKEVLDAENLLKMLDISFEPKSDVVKSLRAGKLDVCKIAEVPAGSTSIYKQTVEDQDTKPFGVCILADLSGSMRYGTRMDMQKRTLNVLYLAMSQIIPVDRLWIYGHTGDEFPEIYTFHTPYETNYALNIRTYDQVPNSSNYDGPVIEAIYNKVREVTDDNIIFISLSDGQPAGDDYGGDEDIVDMKRILERARRDGFVTVSVGMQYMADPGLYLYNKTVDDMSRLAKDVSQVVNKVVQSEFK